MDIKFLQTVGHIHCDIWLKCLAFFPFGDKKDPNET